MPNLATLLKEEISKIVRKEVQDQVRELQKNSARTTRCARPFRKAKRPGKGKSRR